MRTAAEFIFAILFAVFLLALIAWLSDRWQNLHADSMDCMLAAMRGL